MRIFHLARYVIDSPAKGEKPEGIKGVIDIFLPSMFFEDFLNSTVAQMTSWKEMKEDAG